MRVVFAPEARDEFVDAERYYEEQLPGLGARFRGEVRVALRRARAWPLSCPIERGDIRRLILTRFPYKLLYSIESEHLYVLAVAHQHRQPNYWVGRSKSGGEA
jgi:plasmid stabilization system protein ParE